MDIPMVIGVQQTRNKLVAVYTRYSGDDLDIEVLHPSQRKTTNKQQTGNKPMAVVLSMQTLVQRSRPNFTSSERKKWVKI